MARGSRCFTRNGHDWDRFPAIVDAALRVKATPFLTTVRSWSPATMGHRTPCAAKPEARGAAVRLGALCHNCRDDFQVAQNLHDFGVLIRIEVVVFRSAFFEHL